jgi:hypothetical protein
MSGRSVCLRGLVLILASVGTLATLVAHTAGLREIYAKPGTDALWRSQQLAKLFGRDEKGDEKSPNKLLSKPAPVRDRPPLSAFPEYKTAADLAGPVFPVSKQVLLATARKLRIGRKLGRVIIFSPDDCKRLYQELATPSCRSTSSPPATRKRKVSSSAAHTSESVWTRAAALTNDPSLKPSSSDSKPRLSAVNTRKPRLIVDNK